MRTHGLTFSDFIIKLEINNCLTNRPRCFDSRHKTTPLSMKIDLDPRTFTSKDAYVRAALSRARDLAVQSWEDEHTERRSLIEREVSSLSKNELARRLVKLLSRPNRARAQISEAMRSKAKALRKKDVPVREIAAELGISIPSVYNITKD